MRYPHGSGAVGILDMYFQCLACMAVLELYEIPAASRGLANRALRSLETVYFLSVYISRDNLVGGIEANGVVVEDGAVQGFGQYNPVRAFGKGYAVWEACICCPALPAGAYPAVIVGGAFRLFLQPCAACIQEVPQ